MNLIKQDRIRH